MSSRSGFEKLLGDLGGESARSDQPRSNDSREQDQAAQGAYAPRMPDGSTLLLFIGAGAVLVSLPGPAVIYVVMQSLDQGRQAGMV